MVGEFILSQVCTAGNQFENAMPVFQTLTAGPGYTPGNVYSFKAWSDANQEEYDECDVTLSDPYGGAWTGLVFPDGDGQYSMAELDFGGGLPTFNVYYEDGTLVAGDVEGLTYTDTELTPGQEYCYYVTQILEGGIESAASNVLCATPPLPEMYTVTTAANPPEGGTTAGDGTYEDGTLVTVNAYANTDWGFINWTVDGVEVAVTAEYTFTLTGDISLVANFEYIPPAPAPILVSATPGIEEVTLVWEPIPVATKTDHFNFEGGNAADPVWTIYVGGATVSSVDLVAGDEIAIFDGETMVGLFNLTQACTPDNQFENAFPVFQTLTSQPGYTPGNAYSFKAWSESAQEEYDEFNITLSDPYGGAWTGLVFPDGDGQYSLAELDFVGGPPATLFNVYYEDGTLVAGDVGALTYTDADLIAGQEYCYYVTQLVEGVESAASNILCATPLAQDFSIPMESEFNFIIENEYSLTNYPNPFKNVTTIQYVLPENGYVTLKVYNLNSELVRTLVNSQQAANNYEVELNAVNLPAGVYMYRIEVKESIQNFVLTKRMVISE